MPGIAGIVGSASPDNCQHLLREMIRSMRHHQAYVSGTHFFPDIGVYGGWVAHEGSFSARQSASGRADAVLLFSGECFPAGAASPQGASQQDRGDLDPLLDAYEAEGSSFVGSLNGLFSGLLIDARQRRALLFNDRYGSERIYIFEKDNTTYFASEAKALLRIIPELRELDDKGVAQFLSYGSVLHDRTLFRNLRLLPAGSLWTFDRGGVHSKRRYFVPDTWASQPILSKEAFESAFSDRFTSVLPGYLKSNSRIGISLTGGLDTRMIMACLAGTSVEPICYTFGGITGDTLDAQLAARIAGSCGFEHRILRIGSDFVAKYSDYLDKTVFVTDGCAGALGAHEIYLTNLARQLAPIRLTGNFGSEILRSVSMLKPVGLTETLLDSGFRHAMTESAEEESSRLVHPVTRAAFEEIPWHLFGTLAAGRSQVTFRTPYLDNQLVQLAFQASARSRKSSRSALKLISESNPTLAFIPTDQGLAWSEHGPLALARRLYCQTTFKLDYMDTEGLPHWLGILENVIGSLSRTGLLGRHKFLPYRKWFQREFAPHIRDVLTDDRTRRMPYWNTKFLSSIIADHESGRKNYVREIHAILTLEAIDRLLVRANACNAAMPTVGYPIKS